MDKYQVAIRRRIGDRVKQARSLKGLSQEQLAELAGTGHKHVGQIERAEVNVGIDVLAAIAKRLSMEVSDLVVPPPDDASDSAFLLIASADVDAADDVLQRITRVKRAHQRRRLKTSK